MGSLPDEQSGSRPHILILPVDCPGHYSPVQKLLKLCSRYGPGVTVTFGTTETRCSELAVMHANGEFNGIDLHLEPVFTGLEPFLEDLNFPVRVDCTLKKFTKEFEPFANKLIDLKAKGLPGLPTCVISDSFLTCAGELAILLDIPWYYYCVASPAFVAVCCLAAPTVTKEQLHPYESPRRNEMLNIPGGKFARIRDICVENLQTPDSWNHHSEIMHRAAGLVFNSAEDLDAPAGSLDAIRAETERRAKADNRQAPKVFAIGPLLNFPGFTGSPSSKVEEAVSSPVFEFLDSHPASSVLYISFGSIANISQESLTEVALGLEATGVPFVWVAKFNFSLEGASFPPGFKERTQGRGFIEEGWAPQPQILEHPSTGAFLSHCGWNSTLESLCGGVPVITWPFWFDQSINARFLENVTKTGVSVKSYEPGDEVRITPSREDVSTAVRLVLIDEEGSEMRKNARKWKSILPAAVEEGGPSNKAMLQFLNEILLGSEGKRKS